MHHTYRCPYTYSGPLLFLPYIRYSQAIDVALLKIKRGASGSNRLRLESIVRVCQYLETVFRILVCWLQYLVIILRNYQTWFVFGGIEGPVYSV